MAMVLSAGRMCAVFILCLGLAWPGSAMAQDALSQQDANAAVSEDLSERGAEDAILERQLRDIFESIDTLKATQVSVNAGVVTLSGQAATSAAREQAAQIAEKLDGVITVQNEIERALDIDTNVAPVIDEFVDDTRTLLRASPLFGVAILFGLTLALIGHFLSKADGLFRWIAPNPFVAELLATTIRILFILGGIFVGLNILGATAVIGAILGSAGVLGLAVGFAMRDTVENYISSIMLSLRQPFRAGDFVAIGEDQGFVVRLTSRATVLMTPDGNHLRLPNATVFKAKILNYSRNPERRLEFALGVDADDDPAAAIETGTKVLASLPFLLSEPEPSAYIDTVGDSNIVIQFSAWIDQTQTDFFKARSAAIRETKVTLENAGFAIPEPIYRLRFDERGLTGFAAAMGQVNAGEAAPAKLDEPEKPKKSREQPAALDTAPDEKLKQKVAEERADGGHQDDLLSDTQPME